MVITSAKEVMWQLVSGCHQHNSKTTDRFQQNFQELLIDGQEEMIKFWPLIFQRSYAKIKSHKATHYVT